MKKSKPQDPEEEISGNKEPNEPTILEVIRMCGRQQLPIDRIILVLSNRLTHTELLELKVKLTMPETQESIAYTSSWAQGEMELGDALLKNAIGAEKDGYKSLSQERTRQAVNRALEKNFGIDS